MVNQIYRVDKEPLLDDGIRMEVTDKDLLQILWELRIVFFKALWIEILAKVKEITQYLTKAKGDAPVIIHDRETFDDMEELEVFLH